MAVPEIFYTIEQTRLSIWLRQSPSMFGFYFVLLCHTFGFATVVGSNALVDLRILGITSSVPLKPLKPLFSFMWAGFAVNAITGLLLLTAYPTKNLTNPDFFLKLCFIALAVITMRRLQVEVFGDHSLSEAVMEAKGRLMARWSLVFWIAAIAAGRLLSETNRYITFGTPWGG